MRREPFRQRQDATLGLRNFFSAHCLVARVGDESSRVQAPRSSADYVSGRYTHGRAFACRQRRIAACSQSRSMPLPIRTVDRTVDRCRGRTRRTLRRRDPDVHRDRSCLVLSCGHCHPSSSERGRPAPRGACSDCGHASMLSCRRRGWCRSGLAVEQRQARAPIVREATSGEAMPAHGHVRAMERAA